MPIAPAPRVNPPWLFGLLAIPWGISSIGVTPLLLPYLLRRQGVSVDHIAEVVAAGSSPLMFSFIAAPIVDLGLPRRVWVLLAAAITALLAWAAIVLSSGSLPWLTAVMFTAAVAQTLINSANGGLLSAVDPALRGRTAGFYQGGNLGAGAVGGGGLIWLADHVGLQGLGAMAAFLILAPALAALLIHEVPHAKSAAGSAFSALFRDLKEVLSSGRTWVGLAFFLSPAGAGAVSNLISSVGPDYHASGNEVAWVTGAGNGVLVALGAFTGGWFCDRMDRRTLYAVFGMLVCLGAMWLGLGSATPFTFAAGFSAYSFTVGLANGAYVALILEVLGNRTRGASTAYALLSSAGNVPVIYMTELDGIGYRHWGVRGLMGTDGLLGGVGAVILFAVARHFVKRWGTAGPDAAQSPM